MWEHDVEEVLSADGETVCSLVVRFTLPEDVTSAAGLELLFERDTSDGIKGSALVVRSADADGTGSPRLAPLSSSRDSIPKTLVRHHSKCELMALLHRSSAASVSRGTSF